MPKMTKIELDLYSDIDMQLFIKKGRREGVSCISKTPSKVSNKYMECLS